MSEKGVEELRRKVEARLPGVRKILADMRDSGDPDRLADGAFLLGMLDEMSDYVGLLREQDEEWMEPFDESGIAWHEALPSPYEYQRSDFCKLVAAVHEYECEVLRLRECLHLAEAELGRV